MSEWKVKVRILSACGHGEFEEDFSDEIPDRMLMLLLSGNLAMHIRGVRVYGLRPLVDFKQRTITLDGESYDSPWPESAK